MNHPVTGTRFLKQAELVGRLLASLPAHRVLHAREDTKPYESDGLSAYREVPGVVAIPENDDEVAFILKTCHALKIPVVARGSGVRSTISTVGRATSEMFTVRVNDPPSLSETVTVTVRAPLSRIGVWHTEDSSSAGTCCRGRCGAR